MLLFAGNSNLPLARKVAKELNLKLGQIHQELFSDGELYVNVEEEVKGQTVFVLQSGRGTGEHPVHRFLMELLIIVDAIKLLQPKKIIAVLPFYPYRRQVEKTEAGESVTSLLIARLLKAAGVDEAILLDLHEEKILKDFKFPTRHVSAFDLFVAYFKQKQLSDLTVVSPDDGFKLRAQRLARALNLPMAAFTKSREHRHDVIAKMEMAETLIGHNVLLLDDEVNTAGTLVEAAAQLKAQGVKDVYFACTHAVLSGPAIVRLKQAPIKEFITTDSIELEEEKKIPSIKILSVAGLLAKNIKLAAKT